MCLSALCYTDSKCINSNLDSSLQLKHWAHETSFTLLFKKKKYQKKPFVRVSLKFDIQTIRELQIQEQTICSGNLRP